MSETIFYILCLYTQVNRELPITCAAFSPIFLLREVDQENMHRCDVFECVFRSFLYLEGAIYFAQQARETSGSVTSSGESLFRFVVEIC